MGRIMECVYEGEKRGKMVREEGKEGMQEVEGKRRGGDLGSISTFPIAVTVSPGKLGYDMGFVIGHSIE